jgi:hypothetical protein
VNRSLPEGILNAAASEDASFVLIGQSSADAVALGTSGEAVAAATPVPVAILLGDATGLGEVNLIDGAGSHSSDRDSEAARLAAELAARLGGERVRERDPNSEDALV